MNKRLKHVLWNIISIQIVVIDCVYFYYSSTHILIKSSLIVIPIEA